MSMTNIFHGYAPAKINLFLEVTEKRTDGFHNIDSVFTEINLADRLTVWQTDNNDIALETAGMDLHPEDNLVYKAVQALRVHAGCRSGLGIRLEKFIPSGAGLGGGSSDAAQALLLANQAWDLGLDMKELIAIGAGLGSDVPFFFHGGTCVCRGRGEIVAPVHNSLQNMALVLVLTGVHCDTAAGYRGLQLPKPGMAKDSGEFVRALEKGDGNRLPDLAFNRFEPTVFNTYPELGRLQKELSEIVGSPVRLSGSGGSLWFFAREDAAKTLAENNDATLWATRNNVRILPCQGGGNSYRKTSHFA